MTFPGVDGCGGILNECNARIVTSNVEEYELERIRESRWELPNEGCVCLHRSRLRSLRFVIGVDAIKSAT